MHTNDIQQLAIELAALADHLEKRVADSVQAVTQSASSIHDAARQAASSSQQLTRQALQAFKTEASTAIADGLDKPIDACNQKLQASADALKFAADHLLKQMEPMRKAHAAMAWKAFIASTIASLGMMAVAGYMVFKATQEVKRSEWIEAINAAVANGKLVACPDGGICAVADKKLVRLDR